MCKACRAETACSVQFKVQILGAEHKKYGAEKIHK